MRPIQMSEDDSDESPDAEERPEFEAQTAIDERPEF